MRFMMIVKHAENQGPPPRQLMDAIEKHAEEEAKAGRMLGSGGLGPTALGARVRLSRGKLSVTDGPFPETKEVIGGLGGRDRGSSDVRAGRLHSQGIGAVSSECGAPDV
jgi:hypothetical protein